MEQLKKNMKEKDVYVYGGGMAGKIAASYLSAIEGIIPKAIVVSNGHREAEEYITADGLHIQIVELSTLSTKQDKSSAIFINTVVSGKEEVETLLSENGFQTASVPEHWISEISMIFEEYYFRKIDIDFSKEILEFKNVKCYNPAFINKRFKKIVFETMGDELLVPLYGDTSLTVDGAYEYDEVVLKKDDIVIDAGANIGLFACYAAQKGCRVFACEPDKQAVSVLKKQKAIYNNIEIIEKGLYDRKGQVSFYESDDCALSSIGMPRGHVNETVIDVTSIDSLLETGVIPRVDYLKADIEGAERNMLRGAEKALKEYAPKLAICTYHHSEDRELLETIIKTANPDYIVKHNWRKLYAYVPNM